MGDEQKDPAAKLQVPQTVGEVAAPSFPMPVSQKRLTHQYKAGLNLPVPPSRRKSRRFPARIDFLLPLIKSRFIQFSGVGLSGVFVQIGTLSLIHHSLKLPFLIAQSASVLVAMASNYSLNNAITFRENRLHGTAWFFGLLSFSLACSIGALFNVAAAQMAFKLGAHWVVAGFLGTAAGFLFNYVSVDRFTWKTARSPTQSRPSTGPSATASVNQQRQQRRPLP